MEHKNCPICKQKIVSDASILQSCALCGMVIDSQKMIFISDSGDENYFCLQGCYDKYKEANNI